MLNIPRRDKIALIMLLFASVAGVMPFVMLTCYNQPSIDDFWYSYRSAHLGFWAAQKHWYLHWGGRYFSNAVMSLNPMAFGWLAGYRYISLCLFIGFLAGIYNLVTVVFRSQLTKVIKMIVSLLFCVLFIFYLSGVSEVIYWMAGSVTYQLANVLFLFLLACLVQMYDAESKHDRNKKRIIALLLIVAINGCNETSFVLVNVLLTLLLCMEFLLRKSINRSLILLLVVSVATSLLAYLAPGNAARLDYELGFLAMDHVHDLRFATTGTAMFVFTLFHQCIAGLLVIPVVLIVIIAANYTREQLKTLFVFKVKIGVVLCCWLMILLAVCFPAFWMGRQPPKQTMSVIDLVFLMGALYVSVLLGMKSAVRAGRMKPRLFFASCFFAIICLFGILFGENNIRTAYGDWLKGRAEAYCDEIERRHSQLQACGANEICEVEAVQTWAKSIFVTDITEDITHWKNIPYAKYFGLSGVKCKAVDR